MTSSTPTFPPANATHATASAGAGGAQGASAGGSAAGTSVAGGSADLVEILHQRGQRATPQRLVVLRDLRRRGRHATADEIRRSIRRALPGTSTPTVYATLELLVELGLARRIDAGTGAVLYDPRIEPHPHTVCRRCGRVDDLDCVLETEPALRAADAAGFQPGSVEVIVSGVCRECLAGG